VFEDVRVTVLPSMEAMSGEVEIALGGAGCGVFVASGTCTSVGAFAIRIKPAETASRKMTARIHLDATLN